MSLPVLRPMTPADVPACMALKERAGWNQTPRDWLTFIALRPNGCFVATLEDEIIGTATTVDFEKAFSWIGMMLVSPDHRRKGIGAQLMQACIDSLADCRTIKLDATPTGKLLYTTLGFEEEYTLTRMACDAVPARKYRPDNGVRALRPADLDEVITFDAAFFGANRGPVLRKWFDNAPQFAYVLREQSRLAGFSMGRAGSHRSSLGPVVTETREQAERLIRRALGCVSGKPTVIDIFEHTPAFVTSLEALGFSAQRGFTRMYLGPNQAPGIPECQWAIAGPAVG